MTQAPEAQDSEITLPVFIGDSDTPHGESHDRAGRLTFVRSPSTRWTTQRTENDTALVQRCLDRGDDPALIVPLLNSAQAMLRERQEQPTRRENTCRADPSRL